MLIDGEDGMRSMLYPDEQECKSRFRIGSDALEWCTARPNDGTTDCTGDADPNCGAHTHNVSLTGNSGDGQADSLNFPQGVPFNILPAFVTCSIYN